MFFFSLEDRQELFKRISLNTRTLIVVFNEILIPMTDSLTSYSCPRKRNLEVLESH